MIRTLLLRYLLPTLLAIGMIALVGVPYIDRMLAGWFRNDVQLRAKVVMASLEEIWLGTYQYLEGIETPGTKSLAGSRY